LDIIINSSRVKLRSKVLSDAHEDYKWQTDPELVRLDAASLLNISFTQYLSEYSFEFRYPTIDRKEFAVETLDGTRIGNCVYYDINTVKGEAQLGVLIGERDYWDIGYGTDTVNALISHIFLETNLHRIFLKTLDWNTRAQNCFRKCGFKEYGYLEKNGNHFILMEINKEIWQEMQEEHKKESNV